jgi:hypothetical protein
MKYTVCHLTVAHQANDVRILAEECKSLPRNDNYEAILGLQETFLVKVELFTINFRI